MSPAPHTASHHAPAEQRRSGIELSTLLVAGVASAVAAVVVSKVWAPGTIWATAFTPIVVSLVKEALERPVQRVSAVATRSNGEPRPLARVARTMVAPPPEAEGPPPPMALDPGLTERRIYGRRAGGLRRRWKLALVTGLLAFAGCVAVFTLPELVAGRSVTSGGSHTTFFGGHRAPPPAPAGTTTPATTATTATQPATTTPTQPATTATQPATTTPTQPPATTPTAPTPTPTTTAPAPAPAPAAP